MDKIKQILLEREGLPLEVWLNKNVPISVETARLIDNEMGLG